MAVFPDIFSHYGYVFGIHVGCKPGKAHLHSQGSYIRSLESILYTIEQSFFPPAEQGRRPDIHSRIFWGYIWINDVSLSINSWLLSRILTLISSFQSSHLIAEYSRNLKGSENSRFSMVCHYPLPSPHLYH